MEPSTVDPDHELVVRAKSGDFSAFEQLVALYERRLFATVFRIVRNREDAEEVVQDTFVSAIEHLASFREEARFYTWLMRIGLNAAFKRLKQNDRNPRTVSTVADSGDSYADIPHPQFIAPWRDGPVASAERKELDELLGRALGELDEKYRIVFVLRDLEERSTAETAALLGMTETNVKVRLLRARLQLRERMTRALGDESRQLVQHHEHSPE
ncbi:MAG: sigma-70 family RNA polymerase sigma factor [Planctomycetes bacterium]|nr:sigma-70 family RNA polymerase sigma factor [Planctomycetota bacterium]